MDPGSAYSPVLYRRPWSSVKIATYPGGETECKNPAAGWVLLSWLDVARPPSGSLKPSSIFRTLCLRDVGTLGGVRSKCND